MISRLFIVAFYTFLEGIRKKFLFVLGAVCIFILFFGVLFGQISLDEQTRLTINFGLASLQIGLVALALFLGTAFFCGDLEKGILLTIFIRPIKPSLFFLGRFLGLAALLLVSLMALFFLLMIFFFYLKIPLTLALGQALFGFFLESLFLLATVLFFSSFNSFLVPLYVLGVFFIGHGLPSLLYALKENEKFSLLSYFISWFPQLERVNWKSAVVYGDVISGQEFFFSSFYMIFWIGFMLLLSCWIFERKDFL